MADHLPTVNSLGIKMRDKRYQPERQTSEKNEKYKPKPRAQRYNAKEAPQKSPEKDTTFKPAKARGKNYEPESQQYSPYITNIQFSVNIDGDVFLCSKISNLSQEQEIEEVPEGGNNVGPNIFLAPKKKPDVLRIEHAISPSNYSMAALQVGTLVKNIIIEVYNSQSSMSFAISHGIITKSDFTDLDAMSAQIIIQTLEITHDGLEILPLL